MTASSPLIWLDGATGTLGRAAYDLLVTSGYRVLALTRTQMNSADFPLQATFPEDPSTLSRSVARWIHQWGVPTGMVCLSGSNLNQLLLRTRESDWSQLFETNLLHQSRLIQCLLPEMMRQGHGSIVLCSSLAAEHPRSGQVAYAATKGAVESFTRALARECASKHIRVNAVAPGFIDSPMFDQLPDQEQQSIIKKIPLARTGSAAEVAATMAFLLSDQSAYITGQIFHIDGGAS